MEVQVDGRGTGARHTVAPRLQPIKQRVCIRHVELCEGPAHLRQPAVHERVWPRLLDRGRISDEGPPIQPVQPDQEVAEQGEPFALLRFGRAEQRLPHHLPLDPFHDDERLAEGRGVPLQRQHARHGISRREELLHPPELAA